MDLHAQDAFTRARAAFGPFAQGPAAFLARLGDLCIVGVDAMGLRPLWQLETDEAHVFASERGFIPLERYSRDPRPLAPGEHAALERTARGWRGLGEPEIRSRFVALRTKRGCAPDGDRVRLETGGPTARVAAAGAAAQPLRERVELEVMPDEVDDLAVRREQQFAALGFDPEDLKQATFMEQTANEPIGSLGWDGPLAALSAARPNLADYLHETVAVVTNLARFLGEVKRGDLWVVGAAGDADSSMWDADLSGGLAFVFGAVLALVAAIALSVAARVSRPA